jgi:2-keto-4-pentenoate hydratase/2-oxohepta-3-ene-1,7-dioic acid hydratase in catechol pathway
LGTFSRAAGAPFAGLVLEDRVVPVTALAPLLRNRSAPLSGAPSVLALLENWDASFAALREVAATLEPDPGASAASSAESHGAGVESFPVSSLRVHPPVQVPRQTFCTIANYRSHLVDTVRDPALTLRLGEPDTPECLQRAAALVEERLRNPPYVCFKLPTTIIGPADELQIPRHAQRADWELELGVVIGKPARRVPRSEAMSYVAGYTLVNDLTMRELVARPDLPRLGSDWLQSKNSPGFLPTGPYLVPAAFVPDPYALRLTLRLNGELMQDELAADMLFDIAAQIEYISQHAQLLPGDLICTGTPAGCGIRYKRFLRPGDVIEASAPGFGTQRTLCVPEPPAQK